MTKRTLVGILLWLAFVTITTLAWLNVGAVAAAAAGDGSDVVPCEQVNTAETANGVIEIFYCEPKYGAPYKINSLGFMLNEE